MLTFTPLRLYDKMWISQIFAELGWESCRLFCCASQQMLFE